MRDVPLTYHGKVSLEGEITLPKRMRREISTAFAGYDIEVTARRKRKRRSLNQNDYYWSVIITEILSGFIELGNDLQEGNSEHQKMVHEFLNRVIPLPNEQLEIFT